jgi:hypothetical protein
MNNVESAKLLARLPDFDSRGFGLGALILFEDSRHLDLSSFKEVADVLRAGVPPAADLYNYVQLIYNQGSLPACVTFSIAAMQSVFEYIETGWHREMDAVECYLKNGGNGRDGVPTQPTLQWCKDIGLLWLNTSKRYRIGSYAFADPRTTTGIEALKASIAAKRPCVLALLLPADFWNGDSAGAEVTNGYHQICLTGYTHDRFKFVNSWGTEFGNNGFGSIPWSFLQKPEQANFTYAYTAIDAIDTNLLPLNLSQINVSAPQSDKKCV